MRARARIRAAMAAAVTGVGLLAVGGSPAAAVEAGTCTTVDFGGQILLDPWPPTIGDIAVDLPAGEISIPVATSTDAYPERVNVTQSSEIWDLQFIAADGSVIATSIPTQDLPDLMAEAEWVGDLGTVTLSEPAVGLRARHRPDIAPDGTPNSVHPTEVTLCFAAPPVEPPPGDGDCLLNDDGTPSDPTDPDCPTPDPLPPTPDPEPEPDCPLNDDGTPVDPSDPDCPAPTPDPEPEPEPDCPLNDDGTPVDASDPDCPTPDPLPPTPDPPAQQPPAQEPPTPQLPVTGATTPVFVLSGFWMLAAGATMIAFGRTRRAIPGS